MQATASTHSMTDAPAPLPLSLKRTATRAEEGRAWMWTKGREEVMTTGISAGDVGGGGEDGEGGCDLFVRTGNLLTRA